MRSLSLTATLLLALPAAAQEAPWPAVFRDETDVRVIDVEVWVSDKDGQPIQGLSAEDFRLRVDGQPTPIDYFSEIGGADGTDAGAGEASPREETEGRPEDPLRLLIYVDNARIDMAERRRAMTALKEFLVGLPRQDVEMMVASNERGLTIRQGFTKVPHEVFVALDQLGESVPGIDRGESERRSLLGEIEDVAREVQELQILGNENPNDLRLGEFSSAVQARANALIPRLRAFGQERLDSLHRGIGYLEELAHAASAMPGRKAMIYIGRLELRPGEELFRTFSRRIAEQPGIRSTLSLEVEANLYDASGSFRELVERANASRVTIYALDAGSDSFLERRSAEAQTSFVASESSTLRDLSRRQAINWLAAGTGGKSASGRAAFDHVLKQVWTDATHRYSLGFQVDPARPPHPGELEVKLRSGRRLRVRHRELARLPSRRERTEHRTMAALVGGMSDNPMQVDLEAGEAARLADGTFAVPLLTRIPLAALVLLPDRDRHRAKVALFVAVRDQAGRTSDVVQHLCPIQIPNSEILLALGRSSACGVRLQMRPGPHTIAVTVFDELADGASTALLDLDVRDSADGEAP